jgi:hypothetical protein
MAAVLVGWWHGGSGVGDGDELSQQQLHMQQRLYHLSACVAWVDNMQLLVPWLFQHLPGRLNPHPESCHVCRLLAGERWCCVPLRPYHSDAMVRNKRCCCTVAQAVRSSVSAPATTCPVHMSTGAFWARRALVLSAVCYAAFLYLFWRLGRNLSLPGPTLSIGQVGWDGTEIVLSSCELCQTAVDGSKACGAAQCWCGTPLAWGCHAVGTGCFSLEAPLGTHYDRHQPYKVCIAFSC